ncbi:MAG: HEPN domain-containing protein [Armatimonadota bacterium]|nr:HEPN domain-containing protein [bacterium]
MPLDPFRAGSTQDWLRHAKSDLALAQQPLAPEVLYEALCFHAQQTAEKALKAVLVHNGGDFPLTHSIARLITVIQEQSIEWPKELDDAASLTQYAVQLRYPGSHAEATEADYREAVEIAAKILAWAEERVSR